MLIYALNSRGRLVSSRNAEPGVDYYCPCCGAVVRLRISSKGNPFFFCHHSRHTEPDCARFAKNLADTIHDNVDVRTIMLNAIRIPGDDPGGPHGPGGGGGPHRPENALTTMRRLWVAGIPFADPDMPVHGGVLSDYLIGPNAFAKCFGDNSDIGRRIIVARPDRLLSKHRIRFRCDFSNIENSETPNVIKYFVLQFSKPEDLWYCCNQLFNQIKIDGKTIWQSKYKWVMLAGDWHAEDKSECTQFCYRCEWGDNCNGMQCAECYTRSQFFIPRYQQNRIDVS